MPVAAASVGHNDSLNPERDIYRVDRLEGG
jgi:hypothetical protein